MKTTLEIITGNKLICKFMQSPTELTCERITEELALNYGWNTNWNLLMKVVERIEDLGFRVTINFHNCFIEIYTGHLPNDPEEEQICEELTKNTKIEAVWLAIVDFLKYWYHEDRNANT